MKITVIGAGPGGLYFAILMKKARPAAEIHVYERNRADDAYGWGVVFSDETLSHFERADAQSYRAISQSFAHWDRIDTYLGGELVSSTGHGFSGLARPQLLAILQGRAAELGVDLTFEHDIDGIEAFADSDLVVAADGINSKIRDGYAEHFQPDIVSGRSKFIWLGTTRRFEAFTFIFRESEHGLFQVHAYPFDERTSTFIVETDEDTWRRAGLDRAGTDESLAYCERLFAPELDGHRLLDNRSQWINFRRVKNATWHRDNLVLIGDAAHTAHFSIGSGTKLAMEDAVALVAALGSHEQVEDALRAYEEARWVDVLKLQKAATTSREWFEQVSRYRHQEPLQFTFNLMTRSKRITHENLRRRDPALVADVDRWFADQAGCADQRPAPSPMFTPFELRGMRLENRVVVSPMCQYSADEGTVSDWHLVHLGSRAVGGAGLVIVEATAVSPEGRISPGCAGMYAPEHVGAWKRIVDFVHGHSGAKIAVQLAHAGRKASTDLPWRCGHNVYLSADEGSWPLLAPSAVAWSEGCPVPRAMERADMDELVEDYRRATAMALEAGFDMVEIHMAHGYLLSSFISPLTNLRGDDYGGTPLRRMRLPLEILDAVRALWPEDRPVSVRISACDWVEGGLDGDGAVEVAALLREHGCDLVDVSSGGTSPLAKPDYGRMFQTPFAARIRHEVGVSTLAVGAIQDWDHVNTILAAGRADLCALARPHLFDPYLTLHAAAVQGQDVPWPPQYLPARPGG
jgi:anthraniloyl-CoA monooxygenase